ncbi:hypothetical protein KFE25_009007 [Diacronema lutheri]|uniref:Uncharacterized protein n=1 Tax=Diacronema lutheri TaxID=2081491 RepID=A0A8J6CGX6_DIALT|nr:hypothetical protein KFE25_009007 [Diacronema lutheri]
MVLALYQQSCAQQEVAAHASVGAAGDARLLYDRRDKYRALERAGVIRSGTASLRQLSAECDGLVAQMSHTWAAPAGRTLVKRSERVLGAQNGATRSYQESLEAEAAQVVGRGDFMLAGRALARHAPEQKLLAPQGPFRVQDEQPTRVAMRDAAFRGRNAWRARNADDAGTILGHPRDPLTRAAGGWASGDAAGVAARQYVHVKRMQSGPPKPVKAKMHMGSAARMQFR